MENEIWLPVDGTDGLYLVSSFGRVKSCQPRWKGPRILKGGLTKKGYLIVSIKTPGNRRYSTMLHRLVAGAFCKKSDDLDQVNHKDGNKLNNHFENLEWCTSKENIQHAIDNGLRGYAIGEKAPFAKLSADKIVMIRSGKITMKDAMREFKICRHTFQRAKAGKSWKHI